MSEINPKFSPDLTPDQMERIGTLSSLYNKKDPRTGNFFGVKASLDTWPDSWHHKEHPNGWFEWYKNYSAGKRTEDDERQMKRWVSFKARHLAQLQKADPSLSDLSIQPKRRQALLNWGIAPGLDKEKAVQDGHVNKYLEKVASIIRKMV